MKDKNKSMEFENKFNDDRNKLNAESGSEIVIGENDINEERAEALKYENERKAEEAVKKKEIRKKILGYVVLLVISAAVIAGMIIFEDKSGDMVAGKEAINLLLQNPLFAILAFVMFFVIVLADVTVFRFLSIKLGVKRSLKTCVGVSFLGRYYDRITPWAMGGEPFQILYLNKSGLSAGDSCAITMSRHIIRFFTVAVAVILILTVSQVSTNVYVMVAAIASVLIGLVIPTFMLICAWKPKIGFGIGNAVIKFLCKIRFVKDCEKAQKKMHDSVDEFLKGVKFLSANKIMILVIGLCALVEMFAYNSVPYFVIRALGITEIGYWKTLVLCLFVNYASSFAPTPGGAGIAELSFYAIFASFVKDGLLFWAVLFWRIAVFYIPVFIGFVITAVTSAKNIINIKKASKSV